MNKILLSIIIPVYNGEKIIKRAIGSCLESNMDNIEIIIIDNGSTDKTKLYVNQISKYDKRVKYFFTPIKGRSKARNLGINYSIGNYLFFLDADDEADASFFRKSINFLEKNKEYSAICADVLYLDEKSKQVKKSAPIEHYKYEFLAHNIYPISSLIIRKSIVIEYYNEKLVYCEDWLFWVINIFGQSVFYDFKSVASTIHITGINTMSNLDKVHCYQALVRSYIRARYPFKQSFHSIIYNVKSLLLFHEAHPTKKQQKIILKSYPILYSLVNLVFKFPYFGNILKLKITNAKKKNYYVI